ncbi:ATP-binding protein [Crossiella cryophila]|uniref:Transcriptional regulator with XRE-family HTH domain/tetratricopeptide (TPR) repeat protein n=1 Tax=Crossiella cryophila TaxID=43355 RepID=A0A7W7CKG2_9PSEU|nr:helix-turn-helix domain-containing protein [Crossiella cryophila]MBB4681423.1 transcriptional regulator with XRE-family HTH domain/tetratricopeptide (TPR) repeat protein [Crossiella cryophila]
MPTTAFGDFLRFYRLRLSMTQEELAERTGVSVRAISDMERGRALSPQRRTVELLVTGLELTPEEAGEFIGLARAGRKTAVAEDKPVHPETAKASAVCALPPVLTELTGRERDQRALTAFAKDAEANGRLQLAVVHGPPGAGKTALAVDAGHRLTGLFGNGCLFLDLRGMDPEPLSADRAVHRLLRGFGVDERKIPADPDDRLALYRSLLQDRSVLLVLDNAASEAQIRPLLATSPGSMVLVTSRSTLAGLDARHRVALELLDGDRAVELLGVVAGTHRVAAEHEAARRVATLCGGVPLALLIAGNRLASRTQWTIAHLADQLADERRRLSVLTAGDLQVRAAFELSYHHLEPAAARMFRRIALVPGPDTSVELAAVVSGQPAHLAEAALEELADASLLGFSDIPGRFTSHDLLRVFARERLELDETAEDVRAANERMRDWLLAVATKAALYFDHDQPDPASTIDGPDPVRDRETAKTWLALEQAHWRGAVRCAAAAGEHRKVLDLATAMHWYSDLRGTGELWLEVFGAGAASAQALGEVKASAEQFNYLAWAHYALCGQAREALAANQLAVAAAVAADDLLAEAWAWYYRSGIERRLTTPQEAIRLARRSVELFERAGYPNGEHLALSMLGAMLHVAGEYPEAVAVNRLAEAHYRGSATAPGNDELLSMVLTRLADSLAATGEVTTALDLLDEAETLFRKHEVSTGLSRVRFLRGRVLIRAGRPAEAREQLLSSLDEARWSEARVEMLVLLAELADDCGETAQAREHRVRALAECARYDSPTVRGTAGRLAAQLGLAVPESA